MWLCLGITQKTHNPCCWPTDPPVIDSGDRGWVRGGKSSSATVATPWKGWEMTADMATPDLRFSSPPRFPEQVQCHTYTGYCWCVTPDGKPISGSSVQNKTPVCSGTVGRGGKKEKSWRETLSWSPASCGGTFENWLKDGWWLGALFQVREDSIRTRCSAVSWMMGSV